MSKFCHHVADRCITSDYGAVEHLGLVRLQIIFLEHSVSNMIPRASKG